MKIAVTGATGFLGRYIVNHLTNQGHTCRCWHRPESDRGGFTDDAAVHWIAGNLGDQKSMATLVDGCDAVVHAALDRPGAGFRGAEGDVPAFVECNVVGSLKLIEAARSAGASRFVFISTCAVHERILDDRKLDEAHPPWAETHYGAHKAAVEMFVHSFGWGEGYDICALRPTGIYGLARPIERSKWFDLVRAVKLGAPVNSPKGGKEVHALDVARAAALLIQAPQVAGEVFNCYDQYIALQDVARIARELSGSESSIEMPNKGPKNQIDTSKIRALGMTFGGDDLLRETIGEMLKTIKE